MGTIRNYKGVSYENLPFPEIEDGKLYVYLYGDGQVLYFQNIRIKAA